jgi:hypothetical protein
MAFNIAANAFGVVGVCDVVLRRTAQCVDYFQQCRNASTSVPKLLPELSSFSSIATRVRVFLVEYNNSPFVRQDNQVLIDFDIILRDCEAELGSLLDVARTRGSYAFPKRSAGACSKMDLRPAVRK